VEGGGARQQIPRAQKLQNILAIGARVAGATAVSCNPSPCGSESGRVDLRNCPVPPRFDLITTGLRYSPMESR